MLRYKGRMEQIEPDAIRKTVTLPAAMWQLVEDFRRTEMLGTTTEAVRQLLKSALLPNGRKP